VKVFSDTKRGVGIHGVDRKVDQETALIEAVVLHDRIEGLSLGGIEERTQFFRGEVAQEIRFGAHRSEVILVGG